MYGTTISGMEMADGSALGSNMGNSTGGSPGKGIEPVNLLTWLFAGNERAAIQPGALS